MTVDLSGLTILVTGSGRGIGFAIARALVTSGATVAGHYRNTEPENLDGMHAFRADLGALADTDRLFDDVLSRVGRLDGIVLNAGVAKCSPLSDAADAWAEVWQETMHVNLRSAEHLSRRFIAHVKDRGGIGRLIYMASRAAFRGDTPDYLAYAASKGGMVALARSIARGCGADGIRAFVVAPGFTRTDMAQDFIDRYGEDFALNDLATERLTEPDDIAPIVTLLVSGLADHATGCTIDINAASYVR